MVEEEVNEDSIISDDAQDVQGNSQSQPAIPGKADNPFEKFYVVELHVDGIQTGVNVAFDHIMASFRQLDLEQKNTFQYHKVKFYRECKKLASFRLNGKYVMPMDNISVLEHEFKGIEAEFIADKNETYKVLVNTWDDIVERTLRDHPDLGLSETELEKLRPTSPDFLSIGYEFRSLNSYLSEMKGLKNMLMDAGNPDVAKRLEVQRNLILAQIRTQYEDRILKLKKQVDGLKSYAKKKGKRYEKGILKANTEKETLLDMADILGEKDAAATHLESMMEVLAENRIADGKKKGGEKPAS